MPNSTEQSSETYILKGSIKVVERFFTVPLDHSNPSGQTICVFARNLVSLEELKGKNEKDLPYLLYLQGGPGFEVNVFRLMGVAEQFHKKGYQTLWLDQRGTGLSTPVSTELLADKSPEEQAAYLKFFRADSIVKDCEVIRKELIGSASDSEARKWSLLGQSFGGFCSLTYLSFYPEGVKEVFLTGGLAPVTVNDPDDAYIRLLDRVAQRNEVYYNKYPQDIPRVHQILSYLASKAVTLPDGGTLTPARFLQLGMAFGGHGGIDTVHQIVHRASVELETLKTISYSCLSTIQGQHAFDTNPIYAILHEPLYCQGRASNWSAERITSQDSRFNWKNAVDKKDIPAYFTGEMIYPSMFDDYVNLRPLKQAADILAKDSAWGPLYDVKRLKENAVKVNSATYYDDMYVDFNLAQETAASIGNIKQYITNQSFHDGIRNRTEDIFKNLFEISKREED